MDMQTPATQQAMNEVMDRLTEKENYRILRPGTAMKAGDEVLDSDSQNPMELLHAELKWDAVKLIGMPVPEGKVVRRRNEPPPKRNPKCRIKICQRCQLNCEYCINRDDDYRETWTAVDTVGNIPLPTFRAIIVSGGEPLMHPALFSVVGDIRLRLDQQHATHVPIYLQTNGLLLTRDLARKLMCAGVDALGVSIHGVEGFGLLTRMQAIVQHVMPIRLYFSSEKLDEFQHVMGDAMPGAGDLQAMGFSVRVWQRGQSDPDERIYCLPEPS
jgi:sulfatase maturation enzyme AslB (radical SAM superfamily)